MSTVQRMTGRGGMAIVCAAAAALLLSSCGSKDPAAVSSNQYERVQAADAKATPGMSQKEVLDSYGKANKVRLGTAEVNGARFEEWKVEAVREKDKSREVFVRFLYFSDGKLIASGDKRRDYTTDESLRALIGKK